MRVQLTRPQSDFVFTKSAYPALIAGYGCVHPDTKIVTEFGLMRIADINRPMRVLSWNETDQKFQLSLCGGAYPKGRGYLRRVSTQRGEFVAAAHHRIFSYHGTYLRTDQLMAGGVSLARADLPRSSAELARLLLSLDVQHCTQTVVDYLDDYASAARRYGQRLLADRDNDLAQTPSQAYAQASSRSFDHDESLHAGDSVAQKSSRNRLGLFAGLIQKQDYLYRVQRLVRGAVDSIRAWSAGCISGFRQALLQSPLMFANHRTAVLCESAFRYFVPSLRALCSSIGLDREPIIKVMVEEHKGNYYDMQVLDTNNYVCENGFIHHNSGKSMAATLRLCHLVATDPGIDVSHFFPTYRLAKRRGFYGAISHLNTLKIPHKVNKSDLSIHLPEHGSTIYLETYSDPDAIVSFEVAHIVVDELDTLNKEDAKHVWQKVNERARQNCKGLNTIGCVTTPDQGTAGFCYETWGDGEHIEQGYHYIKAGTSSNKFLPAGYAEQIAQNYDPVMADAFLNGNWVSFTRNKVYHFFNRSKHHTDRVLLDSDTVIYVGLDFNVGGTCATVWIINDNMPIAVSEFVSQHTQDFILRMNNYAIPGRRIIIHPDASGDSASTNASITDIQMIRNAGFTVDCPEANPDIRDSVNACNALFAKDRIRINTNVCQRLTNAIESQGYDKKGKPEKFEEHPSYDDWCFTGDTKIKVNGEIIFFKDIPESGFVPGANGDDIEFYNGGKKGRCAILDIKLETGKIISATPDHEFLTLRGWVKAEKLAGEILCHSGYYRSACKNLMEGDFTKAPMDIFTKRSDVLKQLWSASRALAYTGLSGRISMGLFRSVLLFTTKTKINLITIYQIFRLCFGVSTFACISSNGMQTIQIMQGSVLKKHSQSAGNGTNLPPGKSGMRKIIKNIKTNYTSLKAAFANLAGWSMLREGMGQTDFALTTAKHKRAEIAELITRCANAELAEKDFRRTSTQTKNTVVVSVGQRDGLHDVYCLSTTEGCFSLLDGNIVSNCDGMRYFINRKFPIVRPLTQIQLAGH